MQGSVTLGGAVRPRLIHSAGYGKAGTAYKLRNIGNVLPGQARHGLARALRMNHMLGKLSAVKFGADGRVIDYGLVCTESVTTAFCAFLAAQFITDSTEVGDFKYHDSGVGITGENITDTDIETTDGENRVAGTQVQGASAVAYKSVGTIAYTTSKAITEHGLFSQAAGTTLMDRSVFAAINVVNGDSIQFTFELTLTAGG